MKPMTKTACNATDEVSKTVSREQRMPLTPTENLRTVRHDEEGRVEESGQRLANEEARSRQLPESKPNPIEEQVKEQTFPDTGLDDDDIRRRQSHRGRPDKPWKESNRRQSRHEEEGWDDDVAESRRQRKEQRKAERARQREQDLAMQQSGPMPILLPEFISVSNLAASLGIKQGLFLRQLGELGFEDITPDSVMTGETAALVAQEYGFEPTVDAGEGEDLKARPPPLDPSSLPHRPPVVTIMGHVDHGKTTLLDYLRKSSIAAQEHGGITQHIGAFSTKLSLGKQITFLDTPGHAAFLTMRQRGANVTDIVILVVAVDDSVKPQTIEALRHARSAKVPIIVAITKIDKDATRIDQVKADLARNGIDIEEYGGEVQAVCVSGKTGQGMGDLEESIVLLSEVLDIRAETDGMAEGWVLESSIKPVGRAATVLIKRGTLRQGDHIVAGCVQTKVRILRNEAGIEVTEAPPGTAVEILGWKDLPDAGDQVLQAPNEAKAKAAIRYRQEVKEHEIAMGEVSRIEQEKRERARELEATQRLEEEGGSGAAAEEETKVPGTQLVNFTVKCDVHGSVEAVCAAIMEIGSNEVRPRVLWSGPGQITESDVENAGTAGAIIVNFNNPILAAINSLAARSKVKILDHSVIYHLVDDVKAILSEYLAPVFTIRVLAEAEVQQVFKYNVKGRVYKNIAGLRVRSGQVTRNGKYRVMRGGEKVFDGE